MHHLILVLHLQGQHHQTRRRIGDIKDFLHWVLMTWAPSVVLWWHTPTQVYSLSLHTNVHAQHIYRLLCCVCLSSCQWLNSLQHENRRQRCPITCNCAGKWDIMTGRFTKGGHWIVIEAKYGIVFWIIAKLGPNSSCCTASRFMLFICNLEIRSPLNGHT